MTRNGSHIPDLEPGLNEDETKGTMTYRKLVGQNHSRRHSCCRRRRLLPRWWWLPPDAIAHHHPMMVVMVCFVIVEKGGCEVRVVCVAAGGRYRRNMAGTGRCSA
ncbi:hypothetical protein Hanom_Chr04g00326281 [Helianthus anomalus]